LIANALKPAEVEEVSLCFELGRGTIIVREDQLSLAIGRRGQNVRLAARLTGWDIDILTPPEFAKSLEILERTVKSVEGVTEEMLDRMGALGMISVFDIEEVGAQVLEEELGMSPELADRVVEEAAAQAKIVAEQQQKDKEESERKRLEQEQTASSVLDADGERFIEPDQDAESAAAAILGMGSSDGAGSSQSSEAGSSSQSDQTANA